MDSKFHLNMGKRAKKLAISRSQGNGKCQLFAGISYTYVPAGAVKAPSDLRWEKMVVKICNTLITITDRKCGAKSAACISGSQPRWKCINWVYPSIKLINSKFAWIVNNPCARSSEHEVRTVQNRAGLDRKACSKDALRFLRPLLAHKHIHSPVFR